MYEIIKNVISAGGYKLAEIQHKVKKLYILGDLTEEQADELLAMAAAGVSTDAELGPSRGQDLSYKIPLSRPCIREIC